MQLPASRSYKKRVVGKGTLLLLEGKHCFWQRRWNCVQLSEYVERRALFEVPVLAFWRSKVELYLGAPKVPSPVYTLEN